MRGRLCISIRKTGSNKYAKHSLKGEPAVGPHENRQPGGTGGSRSSGLHLCSIHSDKLPQLTIIPHTRQFATQIEKERMPGEMRPILPKRPAEGKPGGGRSFLFFPFRSGGIETSGNLGQCSEFGNDRRRLVLLFGSFFSRLELIVSVEEAAPAE